MDIYLVILNEKARKDLEKLPGYIAIKLASWADLVKEQGLSQIRKIPGYHDEPLKGKRKGQRSIRLNKAYRAIYEIAADGIIEFIEIIEVNKHDY